MSKSKHDLGNYQKELVARVEFLYERVWLGNTLKMAEAIGVSQPTIWRVVRRDQRPGSRLIEALVAHPSVNGDWLLTGVGNPLDTTKSDESSIIAEGLPICDRPLPGQPSKHVDILSGSRFSVSQAFYGPTRYLLRVRPELGIADDMQAKVAVGDLLLFETAPIWKDDLASLHNRVSVVRIRKHGEHSLRLARMSCRIVKRRTKLFADIFEHSVDVGDVDVRIRERTRALTFERETDQQQSDKSADVSNQPKAEYDTPGKVSIQVRQIVGMMIALIRL